MFPSVSSHSTSPRPRSSFSFSVLRRRRIEATCLLYFLWGSALGGLDCMLRTDTCWSFVPDLAARNASRAAAACNMYHHCCQRPDDGHKQATSGPRQKRCRPCLRGKKKQAHTQQCRLWCQKTTTNMDRLSGDRGYVRTSTTCFNRKSGAVNCCARRHTSRLGLDERAPGKGRGAHASKSTPARAHGLNPWFKVTRHQRQSVRTTLPGII